MFENKTLTNYPKVSRLTNGELEKQTDAIIKNHQLITFVESISQMVVILNERREIIYANKSYSQFCQASKINPVTGKRPGESFNCRNAFRSVNGCGTSEFCKSCGAARAISESQLGKRSTQECQVLTVNNDAINLRVTATPFVLENIKLTLFSLTDISHEKRKESLERVFIHDILNSAGGIAGLSAILKEVDNKDDMKEIAETIENAANNLIEEIKTQREIGAAERGDLVAELQTIDSLLVLKELAFVYSNHDTNPGKSIIVHHDSIKKKITTDPVLLRRILGNMIKNALEAIQPQDEVTLKCEMKDQFVRYSVHNKSIIPQDVQAELFKRFYSTKGHARGIGTYSMKLLGEKYLGGKVWFESTAEKGTKFYFELK